MGGERIDLTVIIVSYNSIRFIGLCLSGLYRQETTASMEVLVVDNASTDGTSGFVREQYPRVRVIGNTRNYGFSHACNQGAELARGEYLLFLNPDTIIAEDVVENCLEKYKKTDQVGGLGVTLIDGSGSYLPETRRNVPTWENAFWKLSGIKQKESHIDPLKTYYAAQAESGVVSTDVLAGAFFFISSKVFQQVKGFDEKFFLYGEDIDLSVRLLDQGKQNYVSADDSVLHFKGESSRGLRKISRWHFYRSMETYAKKHFTKLSLIRLFLLRSILTSLAFISILQRTSKDSIRGIIHGVLLGGVTWGVYRAWGLFWFDDASFYPVLLLWANTVVFIFCWLLGLWIHGYYSKSVSSGLALFYGFFSGTLLILIIYALLPENMRCSRAALILSSIVGFLLLWINHVFIRKRRLMKKIEASKAILITTKNSNLDRTELSSSYDINIKESLTEGDWDTPIFPPEVTHVVFDFCAVRLKNALSLMASADEGLNFSFFSSELNQLFSSQAKEKTGRFIDRLSRYHLSLIVYKRQKRLFDLLLGLSMLVFSPVLCMASMSWRPLKKILALVLGRITAVSYTGYIHSISLPFLPEGLIFPVQESMKDLRKDELDYHAEIYALHYSVLKDIFYIFVRIADLIRALTGRDGRKD